MKRTGLAPIEWTYQCVLPSNSYMGVRIDAETFVADDAISPNGRVRATSTFTPT